MSLISKASKLLGVFGSVKNKVALLDLERIYALVSRVISAIEEVTQAMSGLSGEEKKKRAVQLIMNRLKVPFLLRLPVRYFVGRIVDRVIAYKNEVYGKLWGTGEPSTGYEDTVGKAALSVQEAQASEIVLDGVTFDSVLTAIKRHNETKPDLRVNLFCIVQFILETGAFKHFRGYNLGGIKATEGWIRTGGKIWNAQTKEAVEGKLMPTTAAFRAYDNVSHFLDDYAGIIHRVYPLSVQNNDCMWLYLAGLCKNKYGGGYATDPKYFEKLCTLTVQYAPAILGDGWKDHLARMFELARQRGFPVAKQEQTALKVLGGK